MAKKTLGVMLDCSRNAVMRPEQVKEFAKLISEMGYNMLQLYTEDTYEIEGEPFFGHMRGRYSQEELKELDSYCAGIGVELVPCIQVLAHLGRLTQWEPYADLFECEDILMVGDERVYELIDKMFGALEKCFTSRRVNVGMDEAISIGRGKYLDKHGYCNRVEILTKHLKRVKEIADRHGFTIMMWSDMFVRLHNHGEYYGEDICIPKETIDGVPEGVELIYWDYYSKEKKHYDNMLKTHLDFRNPIAFAGGLWTWTGYAPNLRFTWDATEAAMRSVKEHSIDTVFFTMWGDHGKDCSYYTMLPMLFAAAKMMDGEFDRNVIETQFEEKYGYTFEEFWNLELPNITEEEESHFHCPGKYLLFNDPFIGIFDFTVADDLTERYRNASETLEKSIRGRKYDYLFEVEKKLLDVLVYKADLGVRLRRAYQAQDKEALCRILEETFPIVEQSMQEFFDAFRSMWMRENKAFGLEVQEQRFGGALYRVKSCKERISKYINGELDKIEELEEKSLVKCTGMEGKGIVWGDWRTTVTVAVN